MTLDIRKTRCDQCLFSKERIVDGARMAEILETCRKGDMHYMHGSGVNGLAVLPSVGVTYQRLTIEASFVPKFTYRGQGNSGVNVVGLFARWRF